MGGGERITLVAGPGPLIAALDGLAVSTVNPSDLGTDPDQIARKLVATGGDVVVLGPELGVETSLSVSRHLGASSPEIDIVLVAQPGAALLADAMRSGVRDVLPPSSEPNEIADAIRRIADAATLRRSRLSGTPAPDLPTGRIITVMAAKGGVGKTTVAVNVAVELARSGPNEVVLVDLDLMAGDVDVLMGIETKSTVASVATPGALLDVTVLKLSLARHPSGVLVLPAPDDLIDADGVDPDLLVEMIDMLGSAFPFVVIDTAAGAGAPLAAAVEASQDLLCIATPDVGGLRSLRRNLDGLDTLGLSSADRHLVLNHSDLRAGLTSQAIESTVELPVSFAIPEARELTIAANQGQPYVDGYPKGPPTAVFRQIAARLRPPTEPPRGREGRGGWSG